jgi:hypothetical protein
MSVVIRVAMATRPSHVPIVGQYLRSFDVEAFDGQGDASFTWRRAKAMRFADIGAATEAWKTQSKTRPLREDGRPNRPLTAFSITFETVS